MQALDADPVTATPRVIRSPILIPIAGGIVLAAVWMGVSMRLTAEKHDALQVAQNRADILADALVHNTQTTIHDVDVIALVVKQQFETDAKSVDVKALQKRGFFTPETAAQVSIADAAGRMLQSTMPYSGNVYITDRAHFIVHRDNRHAGLYISKPMFGRVSERWTIQMTRRIETKSGEFAGVVVVSEDRRYLTRGFADVAVLGAHGSAAVFLQDGTRLSEDPHEAIDSQHAVLPSTSTRVAETSATPVRDSRPLIARRAVPGYPLYVEVMLSRDDVLMPYRKMQSVYVIGSTVLSISFALFIVAITLLVHRLLVSRDRLHVLSETDALTGLCNRYGLLARLKVALGRHVEVGRVAVVYLDLGNLKQVNDSLGHEAGDQLLCKIAMRLQDGVSPQTVGRFGGDEFLVIVTAKEGEEDVYLAARKAVEAVVAIFDNAVVLRGHLFPIHGSIGIAVHGRAEDGVSTLIREADEAMYSAKAERARGHKTAWRYYSEDMRENGRLQMEAEQQVRDALSRGTLQLVFHPVCARSGASLPLTTQTARNAAGVEGFYVRVGLPTPDGVGRAPLAMPVAISEANGLQTSMTEFALSRMCQTVQSWRQRGLAVTSLLYALDKGQFLDVDCARIIVESTQHKPFADSGLIFEVPEAAFLDEPALAAERAAALIRAGARLMLGTFSGSFAAFALLQNGPFFGLIMRRHVCAADILLSAIKHAMRQGHTVMLALDSLPEKLTLHPQVLMIDYDDAYCVVTAAQQLARRTPNA